jgi:hypothetical protein
MPNSSGVVRAKRFRGFFAVHPEISRIFFNGAAAEAGSGATVPRSTARAAPAAPALDQSGAWARGYGEKMAAWSAIVAG